jgi:tetratricopeptide (TPR) repeat protein
MPTQIPETWIERLDGAPLSPWFAQYVADGRAAMHGFLTNRIHLGHLNVMDRDLVMADWIAVLGDEDGFRSQVDQALQFWISTNWGRLDLLRPAPLAEVWVRVANIVAFASPELPASAAELLSHFGDRENFLGVLSEGPSRDPLGRYLCALARNQTNATLAPFWNWLCDLSEAVPIHHSLYALEGIAGLPPAQASDAAAQFDRIAGALLGLAKGLNRRVLAETTPENAAKREWVNLAYWCQTKFPFPGRWEEFARREVSGMSERQPQRILDWLADAFAVEPQAGPEAGQTPIAARDFVSTAQWAKKAQELRRGLETDFQASLPAAKRLLDDQRRFAEESGDPYYIVRSLCNFADAIWRTDEDLALQWAEEARERDPRNPYTWSNVAVIRKHRHEIAEAEAIAREAYAKFPLDAHSHQILADVLVIRKKLDEAEQVYRKYIQQFPEEFQGRTLFAELLRGIPGREPEAESAYRETIELFPQDAYARTGLAEVLKAMGRLAESEFAYREAVELFPENAAARSGLADLCVDLGRPEEAEELYREVLDWPHTSRKNLIVARTALAGALRRLKRFDEARVQIEIVLEQLDSNNTYALAEMERIIAAEKGEPVQERPKPTAIGSPAWVSGNITPTQRRVLLARISWLRRQAKASTPASGDPSADALRAEAAKLVDALLKRFPDDERALAQSCLLELDAGNLDATTGTLKTALSLRPNAQLLLTLRARVDRLLARKHSTRLVPGREPEVLAAPHRLRQLRPELRPLALLQQGLGYLALTNGELRKEKAAEEFGKLHRWIQRRLDPEASLAMREQDSQEDTAGPSLEFESGTDADFHNWWAAQIKRNLFAPVLDQKEPEPADIPRLGEQAEAKSALVEQMEEYFVGRLSARNDWDPTAVQTR